MTPDIRSGFVAVTLIVSAGTSAVAEVRDAVYSGTMVCDKLPFTETKMREAFEVKISGGDVRYTHVVRVRDTAEPVTEQGAGKLDGQNISLEGAWTGGKRQYLAKYAGTFVRRSAKLEGTQTWFEGGKTVTRNCSGAIKRPLRAFLPKDPK